MAKQRLNHSRYLDTYGEQRRSALEEERLGRVPTQRQLKYFRRLCAEMRSHGIEPPTPDPYSDRVEYNKAIQEALSVLREAGVDTYRSDAQVEHYVMPGQGVHPGDVTRSWTVVRGGKIQKPPKIYNRNGLTPKSARKEKQS